MVSPAQPIIGGESEGKPVIGYNPHLEGEFGPDVFQISRFIGGNYISKYGASVSKPLVLRSSSLTGVGSTKPTVLAVVD